MVFLGRVFPTFVAYKCMFWNYSQCRHNIIKIHDFCSPDQEF